MNDEIFWQAVKDCDKNFDGAFFYAVESTKIYCKPSCRSKAPKRENVRFFTSIDEAEDEGFRACRRCVPKSVDINSRSVLVAEACRLFAADPLISPAAVASDLNVSLSNMQRSFRQVIGVSPKKYKEHLRMDRFKSRLQNGSEVTDAIYEAGFGSSSRLYENISKKIGMTPAVYKKGGKNMNIKFTTGKTDIGMILVAATENGICSVALGNSLDELQTELRKEFPQAQIFEDGGSELSEILDQILKTLDGQETLAEMPLDLRATAFQIRVWRELQKIPFGETATYLQLAERLGNKNAVRAVARACASNRIAIVVPCHRVIRSDGSLSGYRWGVERKEKLLAKERLGNPQQTLFSDGRSAKNDSN